MGKIIGITLIVIGVVTAAINLLLNVRWKMSVSIIGRADDPTSVFVAGKIGSTPTIIGGIILFVTGIFMIIKKK